MVNIIDPEVLTVGGVDLGPHVTNISLVANEMEQTFQGRGSQGQTIVPSGRSSGDTFAVTMQSDSTETVEGMLWDFKGTLQTVVIRDSSATVSANNPEFTAVCHISTNTPISGNMGELSPNTMSWNIQGRIARDTS